MLDSAASSLVESRSALKQKVALLALRAHNSFSFLQLKLVTINHHPLPDEAKTL